MDEDRRDATSLGWCWENLRPWQILHSKLAEREYQKKVKALEDVWQLMEETLDAPDPRQVEVSSEYNWCWGGGEFWGHGGVLESRIREWLAWKEEVEEEGESREVVISNYLNRGEYWNMQSRAITENRSENISFRDLSTTLEPGDEEEEDHQIQQRGTEVRDGGIMQEDYSTGYVGDRPVEGDAEAEHDLNYSGGNFEHEEMWTNPSQVLYNRRAAVAIRAYWRSDKEKVEEEQEAAAAAAAAAVDREKEEYDEITLAANTKLSQAVDVELCAVCLEQLEKSPPARKHSQQPQMLPCRHTFHAACLQPWLQRRSSALSPPPRCPCCRAAIPANLAESCYDNEDYDEHDDHHHGHTRDIMRLLADVEAALHRFGFSS